MLIVCPHCATSYDIKPSALGDEGRSVRCQRCQTVWFASAPEPVLETAGALDMPLAAPAVPDGQDQPPTTDPLDAPDQSPADMAVETTDAASEAAPMAGETTITGHAEVTDIV